MSGCGRACGPFPADASARFFRCAPSKFPINRPLFASCIAFAPVLDWTGNAKACHLGLLHPVLSLLRVCAVWRVEGEALEQF